jgi:hypothetical protein
MTKDLTDNSKAISTEVGALSEEETKHYLTPFAFELDKTLFGLPLAAPRKRAIALLLDFTLVAILSSISGGVLALAIAVTLFYLGSKKRAQQLGKTKGRKRRAFLRFLAAFIVLLVLLDSISNFVTPTTENHKKSVVSTESDELSLGQSLVLTGYAISAIAELVDTDCKDYSCWQQTLEPVAKKMANITFKGNITLENQELDGLLADIVEGTDSSTSEQKQLQVLMKKTYHAELTRLNEQQITKEKEKEKEKTSAKQELANVTDNSMTSDDEVLAVDDNSPSKAMHQAATKPEQQSELDSIIKWVKALIEDLGLGFGWATFYFTVSTALGQGQTLGKKLLGIKVLQLDGTPLSLWDSFGRYGGYGAGLATGLLGFMQVYWDPNRQAIHDKISATVVIDIRKSPLA